MTIDIGAKKAQCNHLRSCVSARTCTCSRGEHERTLRSTCGHLLWLNFGHGVCQFRCTIEYLLNLNNYWLGTVAKTSIFTMHTFPNVTCHPLPACAAQLRASSRRCSPVMRTASQDVNLGSDGRRKIECGFPWRFASTVIEMEYQVQTRQLATNQRIQCKLS